MHVCVITAKHHATVCVITAATGSAAHKHELHSCGDRLSSCAYHMWCAATTYIHSRSVQESAAVAVATSSTANYMVPTR